MKNNRHSLIWGSLLVLFGLLMLLENLNVIHVVGQVVWAVILAGFGLPFLYIYLTRREQWWALIPGCILASIGLGVLVGGDLAGIIITFGIGLPFWLIYLNDRNQWWALIPGWTMTSVSLIVLLSWVGLETLVAPWVMFAIAIPFLTVYARDRNQWWALIPGGIMSIIGIGLLAGALLSSAVFWGIAVILAGVWMILRAFRRDSRPAAPATFQDEPDDRSTFTDIDQPDPDAQPEQPR